MEILLIGIFTLLCVAGAGYHFRRQIVQLNEQDKTYVFTATYSDQLTWTAPKKGSEKQSKQCGFVLQDNGLERTVTFFGTFVGAESALAKSFYEHESSVYAGIVVPWLNGTTTTKSVYDFVKNNYSWSNVLLENAK